MNNVISQFQIKNMAVHDKIEGPPRWNIEHIMERPAHKKPIANAQIKKSRMPDFDYWEIANLIDYGQVYVTEKKPEWRKRLVETYGPCGIKIPGYTDLSKAFLWEWDESKLGELTFDSECTLTYDGTHFYVKKPNRAGRMAKFSIALESWLENRLRKVCELRQK